MESPGEGIPIPVFLTGESHGWRSLASYSPWGHKESDTTQWLTLRPTAGLHFLASLDVRYLSVTEHWSVECRWKLCRSLLGLFFLFSRSVMSILCDLMDCSTPGLLVLHHLPELAQIHVHWVSDAIQPSHPLLSPSPPAFNHSWHQGLFQWVSSLHQVAKVLEFHFQHQSFQWIFRTDFL